MIDAYLALTDTRCDGDRCVRAGDCLRHIDRGAGRPWTPITETLCALPLRDTPHTTTGKMFRGHLPAADVELYRPQPRRPRKKMPFAADGGRLEGAAVGVKHGG